MNTKILPSLSWNSGLRKRFSTLMWHLLRRFLTRIGPSVSSSCHDLYQNNKCFTSCGSDKQPAPPPPLEKKVYWFSIFYINLVVFFLYQSIDLYINSVTAQTRVYTTQQSGITHNNWLYYISWNLKLTIDRKY